MSETEVIRSSRRSSGACRVGTSSVAVERRAEDGMGWMDFGMPHSLVLWMRAQGFGRAHSPIPVNVQEQLGWLWTSVDEVCCVCFEASKTRQKEQKGERMTEGLGLASRRHETG